MSPPGCSISAVGVKPTLPERNPWTAPHLVRLGTVAVVTGKRDKVGRSDKGSYPKSRT